MKKAFQLKNKNLISRSLMLLIQTPAKPVKTPTGARYSAVTQKVQHNWKHGVSWAISHLLKTTAVMESLPYKYTNSEWHKELWWVTALQQLLEENCCAYRKNSVCFQLLSTISSPPCNLVLFAQSLQTSVAKN